MQQAVQRPQMIVLMFSGRCAGFYPAVLRVEHPTARFEKVQGGSLERDADPAKLRFYDHLKGKAMTVMPNLISPFILHFIQTMFCNFPDLTLIAAGTLILYLTSQLAWQYSQPLQTPFFVDASAQAHFWMAFHAAESSSLPCK